MRRFSTVVAVPCVVAMAASFANAGAINSWDLTISWNGGTWRASENQGSFEVSQNASGQTVVMGMWNGAAWSCDWDLVLGGSNTRGGADPFISSSFNMTNNSGVLQNFQVLVTLNTSSLASPTSIFGSVSGSVGDGNPPSGATVATWAGDSFYAALMDGAVVRTLHDSPTSISAPPAGTANIPTLNYGPEGGPGLLGEIGIRNRFTLTPFDNAQMTSTFFVIPAPGAAGLLVLGLAGTAARRRRA